MTNLIPKPVSIPPLHRSICACFRTTSIQIDPDSADLYAVAASLAALLTDASGVAIFVHIGEPTAPARSISLQLTTAEPTLGDEGYTLTVTPQQVRLTAAAPAGLFYGVQTIRQLLATAVSGGVTEL
jgi:hexosaminidase